ncbi:MAG: response regulator, partial [bacterium]
SRLAQLLRTAIEKKDGPMPTTEARVLIIEDNDALRAMLFTILRHQPLGVDTAVGAEDALEKTRLCDYALILIDMSLPDDEGLSFLTRFREERPEGTTFIIAVRDPNQEQAIESLLVNALVNKPLEIDTLADVVRECALVVPPPDDPLPCPSAESDFRSRFDDSGAYFN